MLIYVTKLMYNKSQMPMVHLYHVCTSKNNPASTHWGRETHICVSNLSIIGSDNGLLSGQRQAIICNNAGILLIGTLGTNFSGVLSKIHTFSSKKVHLKMTSVKCQPFCLGLNVFTLLVLECSTRTGSISWLLMPWLLVSPGHQQPQSWI